MTRHIKRQHSGEKTAPPSREPPQVAPSQQPEIKDGTTEIQPRPSAANTNTTTNTNKQAVLTAQIQPTVQPTPTSGVQNRPFDYLSPTFTDNSASPDAILGNSNPVVSHLLNEDFMNWLFANTNSPSQNGAGDFMPSFKMEDSSYTFELNNTTTTNDIVEENNNNNNHLPPLQPEPQSQLPPPPPQQQQPGFIQPSQIQATVTSPTNIKDGNIVLPSPNETELYKKFPCTLETCQKLKDAINLSSDENNDLIDKFINPSFVSYAVDIYWKLHMRWPFLHRPSFSINDCPPLLLVSMITISMYLTRDSDAIKLAIEIHDTLRYKIYMLSEFKTPTAIWVFQALLLSEIFEKMSSTEEQHDMATRFHDVLIASMRRGGSMGRVNDSDSSWQVASSSSAAEDDDGDDDTNSNNNKNLEWQKFIDHESRKRIAFFAFIVDTQHTALFNHPPSMFISDLRFRLPCDELLWEAPDSETWSKLRDSFPPPPHFTTTISSFLKLDNHSQSTLSPWSMMIILHGLVSVGWNMRLRESILPEQVQNNNNNDQGSDSKSSNNNAANHGLLSHLHGQRWVHTISESYYGWLRHYKIAFIINGKLPYNHPYLLGCLTTYEFAHMVLNSDIQEFQTFIACINNNTKKNNLSLLENTAKSIHDWVITAQADQAVTHALDLIDMFLLGESKYDVTKETAFHRTWCLYIASLTVWTFQLFLYINDTTTELNTTVNHTSGGDLIQYLGRIRAIISEKEGKIPHQQVRCDSYKNYYELIQQKKLIQTNEANILLNEVLELLNPCRWGVSK